MAQDARAGERSPTPRLDTELGAQLDAAAGAVAEHRRLTERLDVLRSALASARAARADAEGALARATADLRRITSPGPAALLAAVRGRRPALLADLRAEETAAAARVADARRAIDDDERESEAVRAVLTGLGDVDGWYAGALAAAETWAVQTASPAAPELRRLGRSAQALRRELTGLDELSAAADRAATALTAALGHLDDAWERAQDERRARTRPFRRHTVILTDGRKADRMDQAVGQMHQAGEALRVLASRLDGIGLDRAAGLMAADFLGPFDFLFDAAPLHRSFVDGIAGAGDRVHDALDAVDRARVAIAASRVEAGGRLADVDRRREELLRGL